MSARARPTSPYGDVRLTLLPSTLGLLGWVVAEDRNFEQPTRLLDRARLRDLLEASASDHAQPDESLVRIALGLATMLVMLFALLVLVLH